MYLFYKCNYNCKIANFIDKFELDLYLINYRIVDSGMLVILC